MIEPATRGARDGVPRVQLIPELAWILQRAFGPAGGPPRRALVGEAVWYLACKLSLTARIASRIDVADLEAEVGGPTAGKLVAAHRSAAAEAHVYDSLARELATVADELEQPLLWLGGFALQAGGWVEAGARPFPQLDVLLPAPGAVALHGALQARGYSTREEDDRPRRLALLEAPGGGRVDVHERLRGIELTPGRWASAGELSAAGLLQPLAGFPGRTAVPDRTLMAAHLLVHGIEQHVWHAAYPLLRLMGDLTDLLPDSSSWASFQASCAGWIERWVTPGEIAAVKGLCLTLASGELPALDGGDEGPGPLLAHLLAGALDERYRRSPHRRLLGARLRDAERRRGWWRYLSRRAAPRDEGRAPGQGRTLTGRLATFVDRLLGGAGGGETE